VDARYDWHSMEAATSDEHVSQQAQPGKKEKRFQCSHCQRAFARLEHLQRHERIRKSYDLNGKPSLTCVKIAV